MPDQPTAQPAPAIKKRYEWIDNARIVAAFLIMYVHVPVHLPADALVNNGMVYQLVHHTTLCGRVPFFLILAGYFLARNITWSKAWDRFIWLFIPFAIWNLVFVYPRMVVEHTTYSFLDIMGVGSIFSDTWQFTEHGNCAPILGPSWFLRDIMVLSLLTPLIIKVKKYLPALLVAWAVIFCAQVEDYTQIVMLSPSTIFFYLFGVCLCEYRISDAYRILNGRFLPVFVIVGVTALAFCISSSVFHGMGVPRTLLGMLVGALMIAYTGVIIEKCWPSLSKRLAPLGPACFLVFMLHKPCFRVMCHFLPDSILHSHWMLLLPIPAFVFICAFFLLMKRYTPCLMPYLGHMKLPKKAKAE